MYTEEQHTTIRPDEFRMVQSIFKQVAAEDWFSRDPERQRVFGAFLLRAFQGGLVDRVHLYDLAIRTARESFAAAKEFSDSVN